MKTIVHEDKIKNIINAAGLENDKKWDKEKIINDKIYNTLLEEKLTTFTDNYFTSKDGTKYPPIPSYMCKLPPLEKCDNAETPTGGWFYRMWNLEDISSLQGIKPKWHYGAFEECKKLTSDQLKYIDVSNAISLSRFFEHCDSLTDLDEISNWKIPSNISVFDGMFEECNGLKSNTSLLIDLSNNEEDELSFRYLFSECPFRSCMFQVKLKNEDNNKTINIGGLFKDACRLTVAKVMTNAPIKRSSQYPTGVWENCENLIYLDIRNLICSHLDSAAVDEDLYNVPKNIVVIVKDETEKQWWNEKFPDYEGCFYTPEEDPMNITILDNITSNGDTYIDTGVILNKNHKIDIMYKLNGNQENFFGTFEDRNHYYFQRNGAQLKIACEAGARYLYNEDNDLKRLSMRSGDEIRQYYNYSYEMLYNYSSLTYSLSDFSCSQSAWIFGINGLSDYAHMTLEKLKIYDDEDGKYELIRDYIPVLDPNGIACLYDLVTKTYAYSAIEGKTFTPGEILYAPEGFNYLESVTPWVGDEGMDLEKNTVLKSHITTNTSDSSFDSGSYDVVYDIKIGEE